jgi:lysozyme
MASEKSKAPLGAALIALLGPIAAAALFVQTPAEESGRKVEATVQPDGGIAVKHIAGPQYLQTYLDVVRVPTACDGITGKGIRPGMRFTEAQCMAMLEAALVEAGRHVLACTPSLRAPGRDYQREAAVLLTHNIGWPRYCKSTAARRFNAGDVRGGCDAFRRFNGVITASPLKGAKSSRRMNDGRWFNVLRGLDDRRGREITICKTGLKP